ncbi:MAG: NAD-dependent succinate-semialdehyde dehydrogenase [Stappiaceae bacterium]
MNKLLQNHIAGAWVESAADESLPLINPSSGDVLGYLPNTEDADVATAIGAAQSAFEDWRISVPALRSELLRKTAQLMRGRVDDMAIPISQETGKPLAQARGEIEGSAKYLEWFAEEARRLNGENIRQRGPDQFALVSYEPIGIVGIFTAWNFPISLVCRKLGPAIAAGCPVLVRPAVEGSGALRALIECFVEAGAPAGLVQLLLGDGARIGDVLMKDSRVRKISFTGSVPVGKTLLRASAQTVKRMSMELGGHAPFIVFDDVDGARLGALAAKRKFSNAGQICISPSRFFVHRKIAPAFIDAFVKTTKSIRLGDPMDPETEMGPLVNRQRLAAIKQLLEQAEESGTVHCGGEPLAGREAGNYFSPAVVTDIDDDHVLMREEIFGPIAPIVTFDDEMDVIDRANDSELGLAGFLFTENLGRAHRVSDKMECGIVGVNTMTIGMPEAPFGGVKQSGFGREGSWLGMMDYVQPKLTLIQHEIG